MPIERVLAPVDRSPFTEAFARIREEFEVPTGFPVGLAEDAAALAARGPRVPDGAAPGERRDERARDFVTIDPPGSRDLDQAMQLERRGDGYRVRYAIADVAAFVAPGSALDRESSARGVTVYLPDGRAPMLPNALTEGAASLLPGEDRPALVWTIDLEADGATTASRLERAVVRSRAAYDYPTVQRNLDAGAAAPTFALLREIGALRLDQERERGGVSLDLPTQEVTPRDHGYALEYTAPLPVERWNAQVSLLAGIEAATIMIAARTGIVRVVPEPAPGQLARLRRTARALHVDWPDGSPWGDVVRALDRSRPAHAAFLVQAAHVLRGAGYAVLDASNTTGRDAAPVHAGVGAPYAHVTAPLRRHADRYANEIVLAHCAGVAPPAWAVDALADLVTTMQAATHHDATVERAVVDAVECAVLEHQVGHEFDGVVVDRNDHGGIVQLREPAVIASVRADLELGADVRAQLMGVDATARRVDLRVVSSS